MIYSENMFMTLEQSVTISLNSWFMFTCILTTTEMTLFVTVLVGFYLVFKMGD